MRKLSIIIAATLQLLCIQYSHATRVPRNNYIDQYKHLAIAEMYRSNVPASITLAQGIYESAWGESELARFANNHFGVKTRKDWVGPVFLKKDDDTNEEGVLIESKFRVYNSVEESYIDHSDFILNNQRYAPLFELATNDYKGWAEGLRTCGYATSTSYSADLISIIEDFNLQQYDEPLQAQKLIEDNALSNWGGPEKKDTSEEESVEFLDFEIPAAVVLPDDYDPSKYDYREELIDEQPLVSEEEAANYTLQTEERPTMPRLKPQQNTSNTISDDTSETPSSSPIKKRQTKSEYDANNEEDDDADYLFTIGSEQDVYDERENQSMKMVRAQKQLSADPDISQTRTLSLPKQRVGNQPNNDVEIIHSSIDAETATPSNDDDTDASQAKPFKD